MSVSENRFSPREGLDRALGQSDSLRDGIVRSVGERLAWLRRCRQLSLVEAAEKSGISRTEISRLERDERNVSLSHIRRLARAYDVSVTAIAQLLEAQTDSLPGAAQGGERRPPVVEKPTYAKTSRAIPLYNAECVSREGTAYPGTQVITVPPEVTVSSNAYAIRFEAGLSKPWIPPGSIAVIDPCEPVRAYDLVVNTTSWSPLIYCMVRPGETSVVGEDTGQSVQSGGRPDPSYHRILALIFRPESWGMDVVSTASSTSPIN